MQEQNTRYAQTIDAAIKMLNLCGATFTVVENSVLVKGRDGYVYATLVADGYNPNMFEPQGEGVVTPKTQLEPDLGVKPAPSNPTPKRMNRANFLRREDIPFESRMKFKRTIKTKPTRVSIFEPYLTSLKVGEVAQIPVSVCPSGCTPEQMRASMSAWAYDTWGPRSHRTCTTNTHIEILRTK